MKAKRFSLGFLRAVVFGLALVTRATWGAGIHARDGTDNGARTIVVTNDYYQATITPEIGGRMMYLVSKPSGANLTAHNGLAGAMCTMLGAHVLPWQATVESRQKDRVVVSCRMREDGIVPLNVFHVRGTFLYRRFVFRADSPLIQVDVLVRNETRDRRITYGERHYLRATSEADREDVVYFTTAADARAMVQGIAGKEKSTRPAENPGGWAGTVDPKRRTALLFWTDPETHAKVRFWNTPKIYRHSAIELTFPDRFYFAGEQRWMSYYLCPLEDVASAQAAVQRAHAWRSKLQPCKLEAPARPSVEKPRPRRPGQGKVLIGGYRGVDNSYYGVKQSLQKLPNAPTFDFVDWRLRRRKTNIFLNFPDRRKLREYAAVVLINCGGWTLTEKHTQDLIHYVHQGGALFFVGAHPDAGANDALAKALYPLAWPKIPYGRRYYSILNANRSQPLPVSFTREARQALPGLPEKGLPMSRAHRAKPVAGARVLIRAGELPLVAYRRAGKGLAVAIPATVGKAFYRMRFGDDFNSDELPQNFFGWSFFDDFWRSIYRWATNEAAAVRIVEFEGPSGQIEMGLPSQVAVSAHLKKGSKTPARLNVNFAATRDGRPVSTKKTNVNSTDLPRRFAWTFSVKPPRGRYHYELVVRDQNAREIARRDGFFTPIAAQRAEVLMPAIPVARPGARFQAALRLIGAPDGGYTARTSIRDASGQTFWEAPVMPFDWTAQTDRVPFAVEVPNLREGYYRVQTEVSRDTKKFDLAGARFYVAQPIDWRDYFAMGAWGVYARTRQSLEAILQRARWLGVNYVIMGGRGAYIKLSEMTPGSDLLVWGQARAQELGMGVMPQASRGGGWNRIQHGAISDFVRPTPKALAGAELEIAQLQRTYGHCPKLVAIKVADEPYVRPGRGTGTGALSRHYFRASHGYEMPTDIKDPRYYYAHKWRCKTHANQLRWQQAFLQERMPGLRIFSVISPSDWYLAGGCLDFYNQHDVTSTDIYYTPSDASLAVMWSAVDFSDKMWLTAAWAYGMEWAYFPELTAEQLYAGLVHGMKGFEWWTLTNSNDEGLYQVAKVAMGEIGRLGPTFLHLDRQRGRLAIVHPWTSIMSRGVGGHIAAYTRDLYDALHRNVVGHVDFLHEEHIENNRYIEWRKVKDARTGRKRLSSDYTVLFVPESDILPTWVVENLQKWVRQGGKLIVTGPIARLDQELRPTDRMAKLCGAHNGAESPLRPGPGTFYLHAKSKYELIADDAKVKATWPDGAAMVTEKSVGKGKVLAIGFTPDSAHRALLRKLLKGDDLFVCQADNPAISASLFRAKRGSGMAIAGVNHTRRAQTSRIRFVAGKDEVFAYDLLSGKPLSCTRDGSGGVITLSFKPLWGRAVLLLPAEPGHLDVRVPERRNPRGRTFPLEVRLHDNTRRTSDALLPLVIEVRDAAGQVRPELGGHKTLVAGRYTRAIPIAANDPPGVWTVTVGSPLLKTPGSARFHVE